jgi:hypothetical protein
MPGILVVVIASSLHLHIRSANEGKDMLDVSWCDGHCLLSARTYLGGVLGGNEEAMLD